MRSQQPPVNKIRNKQKNWSADTSCSVAGTLFIMTCVPFSYWLVWIHIATELPTTTNQQGHSLISFSSCGSNLCPNKTFSLRISSILPLYSKIQLADRFMCMTEKDYVLVIRNIILTLSRSLFMSFLSVSSLYPPAWQTTLFLYKDIS